MSEIRRYRGLAACSLLVGLVSLSACGGGGGYGGSTTTPPPPPPEAAAMTKHAGDAETTTVGTAVALPPSVLVTDSSGKPMSGITVTFSLPAGEGGSVTGASAVSDSQGIATAGSWVLSTAAGSDLLVARTSGVAGLTFYATGTAGAAAKVAITQGNNQTAAPSATIVPAPAVLVTDKYANPISAVTVTFAVASGGGSVTGATPSTGSNGVARVGGWTLGPTAGTNTLTATVTGVAPVQFTADSVYQTVKLDAPQGMAFYKGRLYVANSGSNQVLVYSETLNGNTVTSITQIANISSPNMIDPVRLAVDAAGYLYVASLGTAFADGSITIYDTNHAYQELTASGGAAMISGLWNPLGVAVDASGNVYIGLNDPQIGGITQYAPVSPGNPSKGYNGQGIFGPDAANNSFLQPNVLYDQDLSSLLGPGNDYLWVGLGNPPALLLYKAPWTSPTAPVPLENVTCGNNGYSGIAGYYNPMDPALSLLYASSTEVINQYSATGAIPALGGAVISCPWGASIVSSGLNIPSNPLSNVEGLALDSAGNLFVANSGNDTITVYPGDMWPGNGVTEIAYPQGMVFYKGLLYVANSTNEVLVFSETLSGNTVTSISQVGMIASPNMIGPTRLAIDAAGYLYVSSLGSGHGAGTITVFDTNNGNKEVTAPGGKALLSGLDNPLGVAVDASENVYVADNSGNSLGVYVPLSAGNPSAGYAAAVNLPADAANNQFLAPAVLFETNLSSLLGAGNDYLWVGLSPSGSPSSLLLYNAPFTAPPAPLNDVTSANCGTMPPEPTAVAVFANSANPAGSFVYVATFGKLQTVVQYPASSFIAALGGTVTACPTGISDGVETVNPQGLAVDSVGNVFVSAFSGILVFPGNWTTTNVEPSYRYTTFSLNQPQPIYTYPPQ